MSLNRLAARSDPPPQPEVEVMGPQVEEEPEQSSDEPIQRLNSSDQPDMEDAAAAAAAGLCLPEGPVTYEISEAVPWPPEDIPLPSIRLVASTFGRNTNSRDVPCRVALLHDGTRLTPYGAAFVRTNRDVPKTPVDAPEFISPSEALRMNATQSTIGYWPTPDDTHIIAEKSPPKQVDPVEQPPPTSKVTASLIQKLPPEVVSLLPPKAVAAALTTRSGNLKGFRRASTGSILAMSPTASSLPSKRPPVKQPPRPVAASWAPPMMPRGLPNRRSSVPAIPPNLNTRRASVPNLPPKGLQLNNIRPAQGHGPLGPHGSPGAHGAPAPGPGAPGPPGMWAPGLGPGPRRPMMMGPKVGGRPLPPGVGRPPQSRAPMRFAQEPVRPLVPRSDVRPKPKHPDITKL